MISTVLLFSIVGCGASVAAQEPAAEAGDAYVMEVSLDPSTKTVAGTQRIRWTNSSAVPVSELRFHLYLNAFANRESTFMQEADEAFRQRWRESEFGSITLDEVRLGDATLGVRFDSPDDGNAADRTVAVVDLTTPCAPGASLELQTRFTSRLPKAYRRTGWTPDDGFFCMHWFPKLGVLETEGGTAVWNCHQFHAWSEFFADFAAYDVTIDVPGEFVIGATGGEGQVVGTDGERKRRRFVQDRVHDFAFVADPDFVRYTKTFGPVLAAEDQTGVAQAVAKRLGVPVAEFNLPATEMILLLQPQHDTEEHRDRHFEALQCALEFFGLRFGAYPYSAITAVDPAGEIYGGSLGGGMEYPMLITCGSPLYPHPRRMSPEGVTVHEFGHQYWYGLSANNEFEESWLDEGINTYSEGRAQTLRYGLGLGLTQPVTSRRPARTSSFGLLSFATQSAPTVQAQVHDSWRQLPIEWLPNAAASAVAKVGFEGTIVPESPLLNLLAAQPQALAYREAAFADSWNDRDRFLGVDNPDAMVRDGWTYLSRASYVANSYHRPATLLRTLERMVGRDAWWTFLRKFHMQARFKHPTTEDFVALLGTECGAKAAEFFRSAVQANGVFDYGVESVSPRDGTGPVKTVVVRRFGAVQADVRVRFTFEGRDPVWRTIGAKQSDPWSRFSFALDEEGRAYGRLLEVWVDPPGASPKTREVFEAGSGKAGVYLIDRNLLNNAWQADGNSRPALYRGLRTLMQVQGQFTFAGIIG